MENSNKFKIFFANVKDYITKLLGGYKTVPVKTKFYYTEGTITMNMVQDVTRIALADEVKSVTISDKESELIKSQILKEVVEYDVPSDISIILVLGRCKADFPFKSIYTIVGKDFDETLLKFLEENNHIVKIAK